MRGFPKHLNSKKDYEYVRERFPEESKDAHKALLDGKKQWMVTKKLFDKDKPVEDETHKVVETETPEGGVERYQYEYMDDPNSKMKKLGISEKEIEKVIKKGTLINPQKLKV